MAINVKIIQKKGIFRKPLNLVDIDKIWNESCTNYNGDGCIPFSGLRDDYYITHYNLIKKTDNNGNNQTYILNTSDDKCVYFDNANLSRGIDVKLDQNNICLKLLLPSTISEIISFYNLIENILKMISSNTFYRDNQKGEELVNIKLKETFIKISIQDSINIFKQLYKINKVYCLPCALNPVYINNSMLEQYNIMNYNNSLDDNSIIKNYEIFINNIQKYASSFVYGFFKGYTHESNNMNYSIMDIPINKNVIVPISPSHDGIYVYYCKLYYVCITYNNLEYFINYFDFINNIEKTTYDSNKVIICLDENKAEMLIKTYGIVRNQFILSSFDINRELGRQILENCEEMLFVY